MLTISLNLEIKAKSNACAAFPAALTSPDGDTRPTEGRIGGSLCYLYIFEQ